MGTDYVPTSRSGGEVSPPSGATAADGGEEGRAARWFWRFWLGSTISRVGDSVTLVALPLLAVLRLHATSFEVSLITAAGFCAWIVIGLPAGVVVNRLPLRGTQIAMDLIRGVALASLPVAAFLDALTLAQVIAVALIVGFATVIFDVGNSTFLPSIVPEDELVRRNSLVSGSDAGVQLGGPALGGVLVQSLGAPAGLLVDFVSYLASAALLRSLPRPPAPHRGDAQTPLATMIRVGLSYVVHHQVIRVCVLAATIINFVCGGLLALTTVYLVRALGASPGIVGIVVASEGAGALVGAAITPRASARLGDARTFRWATTVGALAALFMPLATGSLGLGLFAVGNAGFAGGTVVVSVLARTHRHRVVPRELLPPVMATVRFISWGVIPLGALATGLAASTFGNREALWLLTLFRLLTPTVLWLGPMRRRIELGQ
jgi:MFS family permease